MLKVVCIVDKEGTALDRLGKGVAKYHTNLNYQVLDCHPKRPSQEQLQRVEQECRDADIIDAQYFKTIEKLREIFPWLREKKTILTHNNPYSIEDGTWNDYDLNVGNNEYIYKRLGQITDTAVEYVPITFDTDFLLYNVNWQPNPSNVMSVIMVANRIEGSKGILPVAEACKKLGLSLQLVGSISDPDYFSKIIETGVVKFHEKASDETLRDLYYKSSIHICNSKDNFESGPMPLIEAMLCGTPCITRNIGHVPDLNNGENMVIFDGQPEEVDKLIDTIYALISDKKKMQDIRDKAWNTVKARSHERRAYMYQKLYRQVLHTDSVPVSIVLPIFDKPEIIRKCLDAVSKQTYRNIELIIADDNLLKPNKELVDEVAKYIDFPVRYINTGQYVADAKHVRGHSDYGLARARNTATIEATGEIMVYIDQRQIPEPDLVKEFVNHIKPGFWMYGNKGVKKGFVENLSAIYRSDILRIGGFNERINLYGGQTQELSKRMVRCGVSNEYVESAKAIPTGKSSNRNTKRHEIILMKNRLFKMFGN